MKTYKIIFREWDDEGNSNVRSVTTKNEKPLDWFNKVYNDSDVKFIAFRNL